MQKERACISGVACCFGVNATPRLFLKLLAEIAAYRKLAAVGGCTHRSQTSDNCLTNSLTWRTQLGGISVIVTTM